MTNRPAPMTLLEAENMLSSDGTRYADRTSELLLRIANNSKTPPEKAQAARLILAARANPNAVPPMPDDAQAPATTPPPPDSFDDGPAQLVGSAEVDALLTPGAKMPPPRHVVDQPPAAPVAPAPKPAPVKEEASSTVITQKGMKELNSRQAEPKNSQALAQFGGRAELREFAERLASMTLPGGKKLSAEERYALAQVAVAHGLDPFNGEIWIIPGGGIMVGVKGLRKKARQQMRRESGGNFWIDFFEISDPDVKARMGIPADALAYEARLFDTETITTYTDAIQRLLKAGIPWDAVREMVGAKPYTVGVGFATKGENSKMSFPARAMKRAEAEAVKRRFDVDFGFGVSVTEEEGDAPGWQVAGPDYEKDAAALWSE